MNDTLGVAKQSGTYRGHICRTRRLQNFLHFD